MAHNSARNRVETSLATFSIPGTDAKAIAELKTSLDAGNAQFKANLETLFKNPAKSQPTPVERAAQPKRSGGWGKVTGRSRGK
jgi:hypothetical protein